MMIEQRTDGDEAALEHTIAAGNVGAVVQTGAEVGDIEQACANRGVQRLLFRRQLRFRLVVGDRTAGAGPQKNETDGEHQRPTPA